VGAAADIDGADDLDISAIEKRLPKRKPDHFAILLIDQRTKRARRVDFTTVAGGLDGLLLMAGNNALLGEAVLLALLYQKAVEMDETFGRHAVSLPKPEEPRREFDPEHALRYDERGRFLARWRRRGIHGADGQGLAEYALILALIAIVAIIALIYLGGQTSTILSNVGSSI
jgi:Flp pilus assembly pilin Flp